MTATRSLAEFVVGAWTGSLSEWTIHEARRTLVNLLAVSLSASKAKPGRILNGWAAGEQRGASGATVIGPRRAP